MYLRPLLLLYVCFLTLTPVTRAEENADDDVYDDDLDDYDSEEDMDEIDELLWEDEGKLEEGTVDLNVTQDELDVLSDVTDYLTTMNLLIEDTFNEKREWERVQRQLEEVFAPVRSDVVMAVAVTALHQASDARSSLLATQCLQQVEERTKTSLKNLLSSTAICFSKTVQYEYPKSEELESEDPESEEWKSLEDEARSLLELALGALRAAPLAGAEETVALAEADPHYTMLVDHARMLLRRTRWRRRRVKQCVDTELEYAYTRADAGRQDVAVCLGELRQTSREASPEDRQSRDEL